MPKLKRLLVSACFETAQRRQQCSRNRGHEICQGDKCLVTKEKMMKHNYCMECTALILRKAQEELSQLSLELERPDEASRSASG